MKRKDIRGYILYHKDTEYGIWDNSLYTPKSVFDGEKGALNPLYCELSGTYDIWKTHPKSLKYILQCQYRRRLFFPEDYDFDKDFEQFDIIVAAPAESDSMTVREQYANAHNIDDLNLMEAILKSNYPQYASNWDALINNGRLLCYSAGYVMKAEDYDRWCEWVFGLFDKFCAAVGITDTNSAYEHVFQAALKHRYQEGIVTNLQYQTRILGYLAERLFTVYLYSNYSKIKYVPYTKMEEMVI